MHRNSLIGRALLAAATVVTLAAMPSSAEARARGFRLRLGIGSAAAGTPAPIPPRQPERVAAAGAPILFAPVAIGSAASAAPRPEVGDPQRETETPRATVSQAPAPGSAKPASRPVRVAGPWCPADRIVGAGTGFCEIN